MVSEEIKRKFDLIRKLFLDMLIQRVVLLLWTLLVSLIAEIMFLSITMMMMMMMMMMNVRK